MNVTPEISNAFSAQAQVYEQAAKVQQEIGDRLFERLDYLKINPRYILDLGCGTGLFSERLKKRYPSAHVIGIDLAYLMLLEAKKKQGWLKKWPLVNGNATQLPFANGLFDLVFANQVLHWTYPLSDTLNELNRVMNVNGCLMFTTLGPDTFFELRQAWANVNQFAHTNDFSDMHDIGDALLAEKFVDPVVDMEMLAVHFKSLSDLLQSIKAQGVRNINPGRNPALTGKDAWRAFERSYTAFKTKTGQCPLTYEVVYGHTWKGESRQTPAGTETRISIENMRRIVKGR